MTFKIVNSYEPVEEKLLNKFENTYRLKLPQEYIDFLRNYNGGYPEPNVFQFEIYGKENHSLVQSFLSITDSEIDGLEHYLEIYKNRIPKDFIPIAFDPGGNLILIGITKNNYGQIFFWDHENEADPEEEAHYSNIHFISKSINEFLKNLFSL